MNGGATMKIKCPKCGGKLAVTDTKHLACGATRRTKKCTECGRSWVFHSSENVVGTSYVTLEELVGESQKLK